MFEGAEINLYSRDGQSISLPLDELQTAVVVKILGLKLLEGDTYCCYGKNTLASFFKMAGNPLKLKEKPEK